MRIVEGANNTLYYMLKDHLGSASVVTDSTGSIVGETRFFPYGETRWTTGTMYTDKLYTGQREMAGLGIYHYNARFYLPKLGRFLSADSIVLGYANPQNLNRYMYVLGNPVRYNDPTGHVCSDPEDPTPSCESGNSPPPTTTPVPAPAPVVINNPGPLEDGLEQDDPTPSSGGCGQGVYSPACPGWHENWTTNVVCPAELNCEQDEMLYYMLLFAYPGQNPLNGPVIDRNLYSVSWPIPGVNISMGPLGAITVDISPDGFTTTNTTDLTHILYNGQVKRTLSQLPDGSWIVTTHGYGNNVSRNVAIPLRGDLGTINISVNFASINGWGGPVLPGGVAIFDGVDAAMLNYIVANR